MTPGSPDFHGVADLDLVFGQPSSFLWLNATHLTVTDARLTLPGEAAGATAGLRVVPGGDDFVGFALGRTVPAGPAHLRISYGGKISVKEDAGLFGEKIGDAFYAYTHFESIFARRAFPCFDEPGYKVPWQVTLRVPRALVAVSNTPVVAENVVGDEKIVVFAETPPLPSYLVAWAVGPFDVVDAGKSKAGVPLRIIAPHGQGGQADYAAKNLGPILDALVATIGLPYPFAKLDIVAIPHFPGGMENAAMIACDASAVVATADEQTLAFRRGFWGLMTHEVGHQWFGDLVTAAWWDDIWLSEAFATWISYHVVNDTHPEWHAVTRMLGRRSQAMAYDSLATARKIRQAIETKADIADAFDAITYSKGAAVLLMFEEFLGKDVFRKGVRAYVQAHADGNATSADLVAALGTAAGRDLAPAFATFLDAGGLPAITLGLDCAKAKPARVSLAQARYVSAGRVAEAQRWQVPVCVDWSAGKKVGRACTLLDGASGEIVLADAPGCPDWVVGDAAGGGYYRSVYAGDLLARLETHLDRLSLADRLVVVDDVNAQFGDGKLAARDVLPLIARLAADPDPIMARRAVGMLDLLDAQHLVPDAERPSFDRYVTKILGARAHALGFHVKPGESEDAEDARAQVIFEVADAGDPALIAEAGTLARRWLAGDRQAVDPSLIDAVLIIAAWHGDQKLFDDVHAKLKETQGARDRAQLEKMLGNFRDPGLVDQALAIDYSSELEPREWGSIFSNVRFGRVSAAQGYAYFRDHFDEIMKKVPDDDQKLLILPRTRPLDCDAEHRAQAEHDFGARVAALPGGAKVFARILEDTDACIATRALEQADVTAFFAKY